MRIFSGIRPTGELHIGNYLGAIKQWLGLQEKNDCVFCIVDWHAITTPYKIEALQKNILDVAAAYLAAGLDPEKCILFVQSQVKEHAELAWLLGTITPLGELQRMTQFKEKSKKHKEYINAGLLNYPILMASDILLYQTDLVPVGKDQEQHVELTRSLAKKFNQKFGQALKEPEVLLAEKGAKIMSLQDPKKKMSKTDNPQGCLGLFEEPEEIQKKIMSSVTDTGKQIKYDEEKKPGISNLLTIYSLFSDKEIKDLEKKFKDKGYAELKKSLAQLLIEKLEPFRKKKKELETREVYVKEILEQGRRKAQVLAQSTLQEVRSKMGLI
ncbi:MAG: tryptophan--tRNA ligase [bacterium]|nr:tryptophan--tRNA ligase [bacterium]